MNNPIKRSRTINKINRDSIKFASKKELTNRINYLKASYEFNMINHMSKKSKFLIVMGIRNNNNKINISLLCKIFGVSKSGYYSWVKKGILESYSKDEFLSNKISEIREKYSDTYGIRRLQRILKNNFDYEVSLYKINIHLKYLGLETSIHKKQIR